MNGAHPPSSMTREIFLPRVLKLGASNLLQSSESRRHSRYANYVGISESHQLFELHLYSFERVLGQRQLVLQLFAAHDVNLVYKCPYGFAAVLPHSVGSLEHP